MPNGIHLDPDYDKKYYYRNREKKLKYALLWNKKHKDKHRENNRRWYQKYKEIIKLKAKKYGKTEKGKEVSKKHYTKRKRNLNWIKMFNNPFNKQEEIEWHHITDTYVVAIPKDLHQLYYGKFHRENIMEIAKQIYLK